MSEERTDIEEAVLARWELAAEEIHGALDKHLAVAFLGSASSGKDSAIRALFGIDFGEVDPIPGSTDRVRVAALDTDRRVLVLNAPGFGDIRASIDTLAREAMDKLDIAIYLLNCDGGATIDERRDLDAVRDLGRPTLVCLNKIDLIRPAQRASFVDATLAQLGVSKEDAVITAFDPLPVLSDTPIGVQEVVDWIHRHLEENGKALLFAKTLRNRAIACESIIRAAAKQAAVAGAIPIPGADATAVTAIQVRLISKIAAIYDHRIDKDLVLFILGEALAGSSKGFIRWAVRAAKTAGWIPGGQVIAVATSALGATIAGATTFGVGKAAIAFMERGGSITGTEIREIFNLQAFAWKDNNAES